ncbi:MAG: biotin synthase BioB [Alphaproteobacteria bacterium]|nr:biotin synthase BioB [Alphaproteobacteria bacterium]
MICDHAPAPRSDWTREDVAGLFDLPFGDLAFRAQTVHRQCFPANEVQLSELLSIKTGGCPENCGYCSQSAHFETGLAASKLMDVDAVRARARSAKAGGAQRFCMGAAWRDVKDRDLPDLVAMVRAVKAEGLESCMTLGMLTEPQARALADAGLDFYNHNIDTSPEYYGEVVTTRTLDDRFATLAAVREAGMAVCCGGIVGMGEGREDRVGMLWLLATQSPHPQSVPINALMPTTGTPLGTSEPVGALEFVRTIAVARILMPRSVVRIAAGRENMSEECQALAFLVGANSIFVGDRLLTTGNPARARDQRLFAELGLRASGGAPFATSARP